MLLAVLVGATTLFMSLITDYEMGLLRFLPFNGHRFFDLLLGLGLVGAPIHFAISGIPGVIFVLAGVIALGSTLLTRGGDPTDGRLTPMEPRHGSAH